MSQTKKIAIDLLARLDQGDIAGAGAMVAETLVDHGAIPEAQGRSGFVATMQKVRTAFPDLRYTLEDTIVDGDRAVLRVTATGTQTGPMNFVRIPMPATNKAVKFEQIHIVRVADGQVVEHWLGQDSIAMFRQLGLKITPA